MLGNSFYSLGSSFFMNQTNVPAWVTPLVNNTADQLQTSQSIPHTSRALMYWAVPLHSDEEQAIIRTYFTTEQPRGPTQEALSQFHVCVSTPIPENTSSVKQ